MKKIIIILTAICLTLIFSGLELLAQVSRFRVRVVTELANIRVKPDISSEMILQVPEGTELEAEKKEGEWFLVYFDRADGPRGRGYIHESLVEVIRPDTRVVAAPLKEAAEKPKKEKPAATGQPAKPEVEVDRKPVLVPISSAPARRAWKLQVRGGGFYFSPSDLNRATVGLIDYYAYYLGTPAARQSRSLHLAFTYGLDFYHEVYSRLYLGLGFDYFQLQRQSLARFPDYQVLATAGVKDLPLRLALRYEPVDFFYLSLGLEFHLGRTSYRYEVPLNPDGPDQPMAFWQGFSRGYTLGWSEAAGFEFRLSPWLRFQVEGFYRYARIGNFEGKNHYQDTTGLENSVRGELYYWEVQVSSSRSFPVLFIRDGLPTEPGVLNARKADLNFSGFALKLGLQFSF